MKKKKTMMIDPYLIRQLVLDTHDRLAGSNQSTVFAPKQLTMAYFAVCIGYVLQSFVDESEREAVLADLWTYAGRGIELADRDDEEFSAMTDEEFQTMVRDIHGER